MHLRFAIIVVPKVGVFNVHKRVVEYMRCTNASEAGLLLRYRAIGLLSAIHAYVARWTAQPLPAAASLQKDASAGIVRQVCLVAATPVYGSVCSLATALEGAVLADRLLGMDIDTPVRENSILLFFFWFWEGSKRRTVTKTRVI